MAEESQGTESPRFDQHTKEIDLVKRDPKHLNDEIVKVEFEEVMAEPEGSYSPGPVWRSSRSAFTASSYWGYRLLTAIFGVPLAVLWGFVYAAFSFCQVWAVVPCLRGYLLALECLVVTFPLCVRCFCDPFFQAVGGLLLSARLALRKES
uniref:caveolin-1-like n=1 Tax=Pristiophorus japonicus TaxID=55135 RepID=UPI00398F3C2D